MLLRREVKCARGAPAADFDVLVLVGAIGDTWVGKVGERGQSGVLRHGQLAFFLLKLWQRFFERRDFSLEPFRFVFVTPAHGGTDQFRRVIAAALRFLHSGRHCAAGSVEREDWTRRCLHAPPRQRSVEGFGIFADQFDVVHSAGAMTARSPLGNTPPSASSQANYLGFELGRAPLAQAACQAVQAAAQGVIDQAG